jgi:hypothetical protein
MTLTGRLTPTQIIGGAVALGSPLSGALEIKMATFGGDTVRIKLTNLTHDIDGELTANAAVNAFVFRADGSTLATVIMGYNVSLAAWVASVSIPSLTASERFRVLVTVVYHNDNSQQSFQAMMYADRTYPQ